MTAFEIPLSDGRVALIDSEDAARLGGHRWHVDSRNGGQVYAKRWVRSGRGVRSTVYLHREVLGASRGQIVDHIDGDGLNNQRGNLRLATSLQNTVNAKKRNDGATSRYRGVSWDSVKSRWRASIRHEGVSHNLGRFHSEDEAARAYDAAAVKLFGAFAKPNFGAS